MDVIRILLISIAALAFAAGTRALFAQMIRVTRGRQRSALLSQTLWSGWGIGYLALIAWIVITVAPVVGAVVIILVPAGLLPAWFIVSSRRVGRRDDDRHHADG
jgi:apolipoprotein N-acyltransferase